jgi:hypothetical protein
MNEVTVTSSSSSSVVRVLRHEELRQFFVMIRRVLRIAQPRSLIKKKTQPKANKWHKVAPTFRYWLAIAAEMAYNKTQLLSKLRGRPISRGPSKIGCKRIDPSDYSEKPAFLIDFAKKKFERSGVAKWGYSTSQSVRTECNLVDMTIADGVETRIVNCKGIPQT